MSYTETNPDDLAELIDGLVPVEQDQLTRLVWDVRGILYDLPYSMHYGRFYYLCIEMTNRTNHLSFLYLTQIHYTNSEERREIIRCMPVEYQPLFRRLCVRKINSSAHDIVVACSLSLPTRLSTVRRHVVSASFIDGPRLDLMIERYSVIGCCQLDLEYLLRLKLSECPHVSVRTMLLLQDRLIPLRIIRGLETIDRLKDELFRYEAQCRPASENPTLLEEWGDRRM